MPPEEVSEEEEEFVLEKPKLQNFKEELEQEMEKRKIELEQEIKKKNHII